MSSQYNASRPLSPAIRTSLQSVFGLLFNIALSLTGSFVTWGGILAGIGVFGFDSTHMSKLIDGLGKVGTGFTNLANSIGFYPEPTAAVLSLMFLGVGLMASYAVGMAFTHMARRYE